MTAMTYEVESPTGAQAKANSGRAGAIKAARKIDLVRAFKDSSVAYQAPGFTPTITLSAAGATSTYATWYRPLDGSTYSVPYTYTSPFRPLGATGLGYGTAGTIDKDYVATRLLTSSVAQHYTVGWSFIFAGDTGFDLRFKMTGGSINYRLRIDGRWLNEAGSMVTGTNGQVYLLQVRNLDPGPHHYQLDLGAESFGGLHAATTASMMLPAPPAITAVCLGDSITAGANGGTPDGSTSISTWWNRCADLMGWDQCVNAAEGGTGVTTVGTGTQYGNRLTPDVLPFNPDVFIMSGSRNDNAGTLADVQTAATALYNAAAAALPDALRIAVGAYMDAGTMTSTYVNANTGLRQAALATGTPFVDLYTGAVYNDLGTVLYTMPKVITGTGDTAAPQGDGNADLFTGGADSVHPTQAGHNYLARVHAQAFRAIVRDRALRAS